ncbi:MAG: thiamine pyrophosphate-dependent enzyme, partial [Verrucomicrobia bacterium]|nr:thiamine pyrophosphate-dependent enzyme [Verrucomicrobiota bacterium]
EGCVADGPDLADCLKVVEGAVTRARAGRGPQLIEARLLRLCGHGEHDDASYVDAALKASPLGRDCLKVAEARLVEEGWTAQTEIDQWRSEAMQTVEQAVAQVQREPGPDPYAQDWCALASRHLADPAET